MADQLAAFINRQCDLGPIVRGRDVEIEQSARVMYLGSVAKPIQVR